LALALWVSSFLSFCLDLLPWLFSLMHDDSFVPSSSTSLGLAGRLNWGCAILADEDFYFGELVEMIYSSAVGTGYLERLLAVGGDVFHGAGLLFQ
jgi:hypothetical protein